MHEDPKLKFTPLVSISPGDEAFPCGAYQGQLVINKTFYEIFKIN
jgi:hypothetical protein